MEEFDKACFDQDLQEVLTSEGAKRWTLKKTAELEVTVALASQKAPTESFIARLRWRRYPDGLPSLKFLDAVGGTEDNKHAWPTGQGMRPDSFDTCMHWTAEGHALHPDWKNALGYGLNPEGNILMQALMFLQHWFDFEYAGRYRG